MPAPATSNELVELIRKSGLVEDQRLAEFIRKIRAAKTASADPRDFAALLVKAELLTQFQTDLLLQGKSKGFNVGEYLVLRPIGAGGMATVYLCEHQTTRRKVAIKVLPVARAENNEIRKRFLREGEAVSALDHPNIVRAFEMGLDKKQYFLVMEFVDGCNLVEYVKTRGVPEVRKACDFLRQTAVGLQHIHEMGLIHRDINPSNILIDKENRVRIVDMGLARFFDDENEILTRRVVGTADFIAPEQTYDSHKVDIRADLYSLGATAYFLLTGRMPFGTKDIVQKIDAHRTKVPKPMKEFRPEIPEPLAAFVNKLMAKNLRHRYQTPAEVIEALDQL